MIKKFRQLLALIILAGIIPGLWVAQGLGYLAMPDGVIGATIMGWGLVLKYFFESRPLEK